MHSPIPGSMHIAINAQLISSEPSYRQAGVHTYSRQLVTALGELAQAGATPHRFTVFVHTPDLRAPGVELRVTSPVLERPPVRILWEQAVLPGALRAAGADLVHGLVNVLPLAAPIPGVVTVHDLSFLRLPGHFPPLKRLYLSALCRASVLRAAHIIAVSRQTASDLVHFWRVSPARVSMIPNGVDSRFRPASAQEAAAFRAAKGLPERYWLYLGTLEPRKNLTLLLEAFARWRRQAPPADQGVQLVLAGAQGWYYQAIYARAHDLGLHEAVRFPGYVADEELPDWYRAAEAFLYPSRFEGFGLPVLEAMACGAPVLCSNAAGVREVAGEAALLLPPDDAGAWVAGFTLIAGQPALRAALRAAGLARARRFSWSATAAQTLDVYAQALQNTHAARSTAR
ncbi:MAG TPA: glycosyltransferase family 1 protein [Caldilineaceae bacterium]|nr:glycosyltransferase family 1 protein [Caldilineaceae bacterium]